MQQEAQLLLFCVCVCVLILARDGAMQHLHSTPSFNSGPYQACMGYQFMKDSWKFDNQAIFHIYIVLNKPLRTETCLM